MTNSEQNKKGKKKLPLFLDNGLPVVQQATKVGLSASVNRQDSYLSSLPNVTFENPLLVATAFKMMSDLDPTNARLIRENDESYEAFVYGVSCAAHVLGRAMEDNGLALLAEVGADEGFDNPHQLRDVLNSKLGLHERTFYAGILKRICASYYQERKKAKLVISALIAKETSPVDFRGPAKDASERYWGVSERD